jgi:hypothetical protein
MRILEIHTQFVSNNLQERGNFGDTGVDGG